MLCAFEEAFRHFTLDPMLSFSLMFGLRYFCASLSLSLVEPPALIHQFYFGLSFAHETQQKLRLSVCVWVWYPHYTFFFSSVSLSCSSMLFPTANVFIIIFFNSFCNLLWRRVHADFFPTVTIFRFFSSSFHARDTGEKKNIRKEFSFSLRKKAKATRARENRVSLKSVFVVYLSTRLRTVARQSFVQSLVKN